jgi:hypothetical protein
MREFTLGLSGAAGTNGIALAVGQNTLNFINPAAAPSINIELLRHWAGQSQNATSAQQRIQLVSQVTAFPTLTGATPQKLKRQDPNASVIVSGTAGAAGTCGVNASAVGGGAKTVIWDDFFNVLNGYLKVATPAETEIFPAGSASGVGLWFPQTPGTLTGWGWGQNFREI